ncbi:hypothetical protein DFH11DRAFT_1551324 [Phellopilus nigrolimitatus]|nr:hypothetical protein DFH11DRAFT_1551324 [Phellopilus nigrolimitatus]
MPLDSSAVPNEIWFEIAMLSDFKAVLALEATCKFLRDVVLNRLFWLECLRALEQDHAPDLPHHVSISDTELGKTTHPSRSAPTRPTRETTICVGSVNLGGGPGGRDDRFTVEVARLSGDISTVSILGKLLVTFWKEKRSVEILECQLVDVHLVDGYIIGVLQHYPNESISLSSLHNSWPSASGSRVVQTLALGRDIPYSSCLIPRTPSYRRNHGKLSICAFHWKPEAERKRKGITITIYTAGVSESGTNGHLPSITHLERPGTIILDPDLSMYSLHPQEEARMLATVSCKGRVEYRTLNMPHAIRAKVEFYSGALYFSTEESVVIQYFD